VSARLEAIAVGIELTDPGEREPVGGRESIADRPFDLGAGFRLDQCLIEFPDNLVNPVESGELPISALEFAISLA